MDLSRKILLLKGIGKVLAVIGIVLLILSIAFQLLGGEYDLPGTGELLADMFVPGIVCFIVGCVLYLTGYFIKIVKE